ncbi:hypothetical protein YSU_03545 [Campylobacter coli RM5611]|nr:hypothetical protein YSU_03545 [Campylobacter coli RM5611]
MFNFFGIKEKYGRKFNFNFIVTSCCAICNFLFFGYKTTTKTSKSA